MRELSAKLYCNYLFAKEKAKKKFEEMIRSEDGGVGTVETIILVAIAVIVAGFILNALTSTGFTKESDNTPCGLIDYMFDKIKVPFEGLFTQGGTGGGTP